MQPQTHSGEWLAPWLKRQACADWQLTDARKHNYRGWVLIPLHPPCLSPPALHPSSQLLWITIVKRSNCAKWLQMHRWHGGCRHNGLNMVKKVFFWKPFDNFSLYCSRVLACSKDFEHFYTNYYSFTFSKEVYTSSIQRQHEALINESSEYQS